MPRHPDVFSKTVGKVEENLEDFTILDLTFGELNVGDCAVLGKALSGNTHLTALNLSTNPKIGDKGIKHFSFAKPAFQIVALWHTGLTKITPEMAQDFAQSKVIKLSLGRNKLQDADAIILAAQVPSLLVLNLAENKLTSRAACCFQEKPLISINLASNKIDNKGGIALALNPYLSKLNLYNNKLGDKTLNILAQNRTITALNVNLNTGVTAAGVLDFAEHNTTVTALEIWTDVFVEDSVKKMLARNRSNAASFLEACQSGDLDIIIQLLTRKLVSPYATERTFDHFEPMRADSLNTGLHLAILSKRYDIAAYLSKEYPHLLNMRNKDNQTPLQLAEALLAADKIDSSIVAILKGAPVPAKLKSVNLEASGSIHDGVAAATASRAFPQPPPAASQGHLLAATRDLSKRQPKKAYIKPTEQAEDFHVSPSRSSTA